jgi:DNA-binding NarL/FixJ family response regulator
VPLSREVARLLISSFQRFGFGKASALLSPREGEIVRYLFQGYTDKQLAGALHVSVRTVHAHMQRIFQTLHVHTRREAISKFIDLR